MMERLQKHWIWLVIVGTTAMYAPLAGRTGEERARQRSLETLTEVMARYATEHRLSLPQQLQGFNLEGYAYAPQVSEPDRLVFRRQGAPHA